MKRREIRGRLTRRRGYALRIPSYYLIHLGD